MRTWAWLMVFALLATPVRSARFDTPPGQTTIKDDALQYGSWHGNVSRELKNCSMSASLGQNTSATFTVYAISMHASLILQSFKWSSGTEQNPPWPEITVTLGFQGTKDFPVKASLVRFLGLIIDFKQNDRIVAELLSGAKILRVSVPGEPELDWDIAEFGAAYEYLRDCAMSRSLPTDIIKLKNFDSSAGLASCLTTGSERVGWCLYSDPFAAGVRFGTAHFAGVDSPLVSDYNKNPLQPDAIASRGAMSTYVIHAANKDAELESLGSGVAVGRHTLLTNCHVVMSQSLNRDQAGVKPEGANKFPFDRVYDTVAIEAQDGDGSLWPAQVTSHHCEFDLALLTTIADLYPVLGIRPFDDLRKGESVYALGAPQGLSGTFTSGNIANLVPHAKYSPIMPDVDLVFSTAAISHGNSGGGLFDQYGDLIGLNQAALPALPGIFVVIPIVELMRTPI